MPLNAKHITAFRRATRENGITFNDGYNAQVYGLTKRQYDLLERCSRDIHGTSEATISELKSYIYEQKKVGLSRAPDDLINDVKVAFA